MNLWEFIELLEENYAKSQRSLPVENEQCDKKNESAGLYCKDCCTIFASLNMFRQHFKTRIHIGHERIGLLHQNEQGEHTFKKVDNSPSFNVCMAHLYLEVTVNSIFVKCFCKENSLTVDSFLKGSKEFCAGKYY